MHVISEPAIKLSPLDDVFHHTRASDLRMQSNQELNVQILQDHTSNTCEQECIVDLAII